MKRKYLKRITNIQMSGDGYSFNIGERELGFLKDEKQTSVSDAEVSIPRVELSMLSHRTKRIRVCSKTDDLEILECLLATIAFYCLDLEPSRHDDPEEASGKLQDAEVFMGQYIKMFHEHEVWKKVMEYLKHYPLRIELYT